MPRYRIAIPPDARDSLVGMTVAGKYYVLSMLGFGGMSVVYKAKVLGRPKLTVVAIKTLRTAGLNDELLVKRFQREAELLSKLNHPRIVQVHDYGHTRRGQPYFVMDFLTGTNLADLIDKERIIAPERAAKIFDQVCGAVDHAHRCGVIHRDLKPGNIMLLEQDGEKDFVKVVDFGIARFEEEAQRLTRMGEVWGSPIYMSPEQCMGAPLDTRSDVYSMGIVMYEALTGLVPFFGKNYVDTMGKQIQDPPRPFAEVRPDLRIPPQIENVVFKALMKNPDERYQSMAELRVDLQNAFEDGAEQPNARGSKQRLPAQSIAALRASQSKMPGAAPAGKMSHSKMPAAPNKSSQSKMPAAPNKSSQSKMPAAPNKSSQSKMPAAPNKSSQSKMPASQWPVPGSSSQSKLPPAPGRSSQSKLPPAPGRSSLSNLPSAVAAAAAAAGRSSHQSLPASARARNSYQDLPASSDTAGKRPGAPNTVYAQNDSDTRIWRPIAIGVICAVFFTVLLLCVFRWTQILGTHHEEPEFGRHSVQELNSRSQDENGSAGGAADSDGRSGSRNYSRPGAENGSGMENENRSGAAENNWQRDPNERTGTDSYNEQPGHKILPPPLSPRQSEVDPNKDPVTSPHSYAYPTSEPVIKSFQGGTGAADYGTVSGARTDGVAQTSSVLPPHAVTDDSADSGAQDSASGSSQSMNESAQPASSAGTTTPPHLLARTAHQSATYGSPDAVAPYRADDSP